MLYNKCQATVIVKCVENSVNLIFFYFYDKDLQFVSRFSTANCLSAMIDGAVCSNYEYIAVETDNPRRYRVGTVMNLARDPGFSLSAPSSITCLE